MAFRSGVDISEHQGLIDWDKLKATGIQFVYIRWCNGVVLDRQAVRNCREARRVGIEFGLYCYWHPMFRADRQAKMLAAGTRQQKAILVPMLDIEAHDDQRPITIISKLNRSVEYLTAEFRKPPTIYTAQWFWGVRVKSARFSHCPLWVAQYVHYSRKAFRNPAHAIPKDPALWGKYAMSHDRPVAVTGWDFQRYSAWQFAGGYDGIGLRFGVESTDIDVNVMKESDYSRFRLP